MRGGFGIVGVWWPMLPELGFARVIHYDNNRVQQGSSKINTSAPKADQTIY